MYVLAAQTLLILLHHEYKESLAEMGKGSARNSSETRQGWGISLRSRFNVKGPALDVKGMEITLNL